MRSAQDASVHFSVKPDWFRVDLECNNGVKGHPYRRFYSSEPLNRMKCNSS